MCNREFLFPIRREGAEVDRRESVRVRESRNLHECKSESERDRASEIESESERDQASESEKERGNAKVRARV